ncbi:MAG: thioredoxin-dependent thiol peroxidase [Bacteroidetes bacterium]|nr:thioredoxin-dependent thiol peroxidase [Bacteroidota bacterium]MDA1335647.1 thioredoxin-dependent thiol peroxidase [Bacteroidota bacterium]
MTKIASPITAGHDAPDFSTTVQDGTTRQLSDYTGSKLALYFYPRDMTPGCTAQACNLTEHYAKLKSHGIEILGVSPDPASKHLKFIDKYALPFDLACDEDLSLHEAFGVWGLKKFMGKEYEGTHRTTFLIDESGCIQAVITKPKTKDHAAEIIDGFAQN